MKTKLKIILLGLAGIFFLLIAAAQVSIFKGHSIWRYGVLVSSYSVNGVLNAPIISSSSYLNRTDQTIINDTNGYDIWVASYPSIDTSKLQSVKFYPGQSESISGRSLSPVYGRTLAGSSNQTTVWVIISEDK